MVQATTVEEMREAIRRAHEARWPLLILGGGSNLLISDAGWPGLVILNGITGIEFEPVNDEMTRAIAGGGTGWDDLVRQCVDADLQGIECLSGIPGTVGASPIQNIGAYGQEVKDTIEWVEALDRSSLELRRFAAAECGFGYRWSRFKGEDKDRYVVTRVAFLLRRGGTPTLRYGDLTRYFADAAIEQPTLHQVREAVIAVRRAKGMVVADDLPDSRSCGSFFMNPIVPEAVADEIAQRVAESGLLRDGEKMPRYEAGEGQAKLSAAWLMEKSGLAKGHVHHNVGLSTCHVLAIINRGGGTSAQVLSLVKHVQATVRESFGIELHPEPVFVGFGDADDGSNLDA